MTPHRTSFAHRVIRAFRHRRVRRAFYMLLAACVSAWMILNEAMEKPQVFPSVVDSNKVTHSESAIEHRVRSMSEGDRSKLQNLLEETSDEKLQHYVSRLQNDSAYRANVGEALGVAIPENVSIATAKLVVNVLRDNPVVAAVPAEVLSVTGGEVSISLYVIAALAVVVTGIICLISPARIKLKHSHTSRRSLRPHRRKRHKLNPPGKDCQW